MPRIPGLSALLLVFALVPLGAAAGVTIVDNGSTHTAEGELATTGGVGFDNASIECDLGANTLNCNADDGAGKYTWCWTDDAVQKQLFAAIGPTATVKFAWDPASRRCTSLRVTNHNRKFGLRSPNALFYQITPVVDRANRIAYGSMNLAGNGTQGQVACAGYEDQIECSLFAPNGGGSTMCTTSVNSPLQTYADMRIAVSGVNASSYLYVQWDQTQPMPRCTNIYVSNASYFVR